jgi:hypothetical protein
MKYHDGMVDETQSEFEKINLDAMLDNLKNYEKIDLTIDAYKMFKPDEMNNVNIFLRELFKYDDDPLSRHVFLKTGGILQTIIMLGLYPKFEKFIRSIPILTEELKRSSPSGRSPRRFSPSGKKSPKRSSPSGKSPKRFSPSRRSPRRFSPNHRSPRVASKKRKSIKYL